MSSPKTATNTTIKQLDILPTRIFTPKENMNIPKRMTSGLIYRNKSIFKYRIYNVVISFTSIDRIYETISYYHSIDRIYGSINSFKMFERIFEASNIYHRNT